MRISLKRSLTCFVASGLICFVTILFQTFNNSQFSSHPIYTNEVDLDVHRDRFRERQRVEQIHSNADRIDFPLQSPSSNSKLLKPLLVAQIESQSSHSHSSTSTSTPTPAAPLTPNDSSYSPRPYPPLNASGTAPGTPMWLTNIFARMTGLGNRLFNVASLYGLARASGAHVPLLFHDDWLPCRLFGTRAGVCCTPVCAHSFSLPHCTNKPPI